ncbi:SIR2 family protein [Rhizobium sp. G21]|uniref:SIR2 family protein n=1 Tax=Rhizobium sp. G21 TaxID=2758439 RepID=UPI0015FEBAFB|nr:SIR2 family protein [Rhizobium sp. G21]MBB1250780.1 SIR2 family protein [Rhizobium sp. G21]
MSIDWSEVVPDLARRRVILVIGSGISRHSQNENGLRPPTWRDFLNQAVIDCPEKGDLDSIKQAIAQYDYLHACEWLKKRFDSRWTKYLRDTFSNPGFPAAEIHQQILNLDCRIVFTLNFDDIYERHADSVHMGSFIVKNYYEEDVEEVLRGAGRYIVKVHGNLKSTKNLIFTQKDYSEARIKNSSFYQMFDAALMTHTFLFLGCGMSDPDVNLLLENQNFRYQEQGPHFFVTSHGIGADRKLSLRENRNLKVLEYDPFDEIHSGLVAELKALNAFVETEKFDLTKSLNW